jgi:uncharacterized membrane protein YhaH (DUF805 family)
LVPVGLSTASGRMTTVLPHRSGRSRGEAAVTFIEAARAPLGKLTVFPGRASRQEFWSFVLVLWVVVIAIALVIRLLAPGLSVVLAFPITLVTYVAIWAVAVRRLHDRNMSGWTLLVAFVPVVGVVAVLVFLAMPGDPQANRFDPHPDQRATSGRLAELLELRDRGEISDEEWMALRSEALGAKQPGQ